MLVYNLTKIQGNLFDTIYPTTGPFIRYDISNYRSLYRKRIQILLNNFLYKTSQFIIIIIIIITQYCASDKIEKNEIGGACSA